MSDEAMVARGELGAQIHLEQVPSMQEAIINICQSLNRPVIVASASSFNDSVPNTHPLMLRFYILPCRRVLSSKL
jgi:hypothetical protein